MKDKRNTKYNICVYKCVWIDKRGKRKEGREREKKGGCSEGGLICRIQRLKILPPIALCHFGAVGLIIPRDKKAAYRTVSGVSENVITIRQCKKAIGWYAGVKEERYTSLSLMSQRKKGGGEDSQTDANCVGSRSAYLTTETTIK